MEEQRDLKSSKHICAGLLAHVDAGKTTLAEGILYLTGGIRRLGRVDHQDAFFDNFEIERERGITIFSKQAQVTLRPEVMAAAAAHKSTPGSAELRERNAGAAASREGAPGDSALRLTLLDTPGHVDFSAEMERTLQVLDYAILVISGSDGVQSHVETLWRLLSRYEIPVFLFVNKMDRPGTDRAALMAELTQKLDERCVDFSGARAMEAMTGVERKTPRDSAAKGETEPVPERMSAADNREYYASEEFQEALAMCDEELLEIYASGETIGTEEIRRAIAARKVFPCYFGSALKLWGVQELLEGIRIFSVSKVYPDEFGARVYKITRDAQGNRLTHMKITGGTLRVRDVLTNRRRDEILPGKTEGADDRAHLPGIQSEREIWEEKVNQIRIFSGPASEAVTEAEAGSICAVTGLEHTCAGEGLGAEPGGGLPVLEPVLSYRMELPEGTDVHQAFRQLKQLEEEEPELHITWTESTSEIHAQLMGEVQTEILQSMIRERFGLEVKFGEGSILYRETIAAPVVGMGHFEPLRHYAEVHLLLEPAERGSGLQFETACSEEALAGNWQRLIRTHLEEKAHLGVLTGSEITDMKITLIAGRAHQKHTEGGDFRQATYRAVRQGLCRAQSVLLEPVYSFRMEVPMESVGRALSDIQRMCGTAEPPEMMRSSQGYKSAAAGIAKDGTGVQGTAGMQGSSVSPGSYVSPGSNVSPGGDWMVIRGTAPVVTMRGYQSELLSYTKGRGRLFCRMSGYEECHNAQEVIEARAYNAEVDLENPCGSVFCAHGAGFVVNWQDVPDYAHIQGTDAYAAAAEAGLRGEDRDTQGNRSGNAVSGGAHDVSAGTASAPSVSDEELREIFERTYGPSKWDTSRSVYGTGSGKSRASDAEGNVRDFGRKRKPAHLAGAEECLLVDGYNVIFAWDELKELAKTSLESARGRLLDLMSNYQGYKGNYLIVVFDAYRVEGHATEVSRYHNIYVVFTKEAETADQYIEKTVRTINRKYHVTVATSDALEQVIILGAGASRLSARGLRDEVERMQKDLRENYMNNGNAASGGSKTYLLDGQEDMREALPPEDICSPQMKK